MTCRVEFTTVAARQVKNLPRAAPARVLEATLKLQDDPHLRGACKLAGEELARRIRVGDYRVIYEVMDVMLTLDIAPSRNAQVSGWGGAQSCSVCHRP